MVYCCSPIPLAVGIYFLKVDYMEIENIDEKHSIFNYSNPRIVRKMADKYLGKNVKVYLSTRKDKKYMVLNPSTNKMVHFGAMDYEDFTKHQSELRRQYFRARNHKWRDAEKYTPSWLSYYLLW